MAVGGAHDAWNGRHRLQRHRVVVVLRPIKRKNMRCLRESQWSRIGARKKESAGEWAGAGVGAGAFTPLPLLLTFSLKNKCMSFSP